MLTSCIQLWGKQCRLENQSVVASGAVRRHGQLAMVAFPKTVPCVAAYSYTKDDVWYVRRGGRSVNDKGLKTVPGAPHRGTFGGVNVAVVALEVP